MPDRIRRAQAGARPHWGLIDVYSAVIPEFPFQPALPVNYGEHVLRVTDGLPKLKDVPRELGGAGVVLAE